MVLSPGLTFHSNWVLTLTLAQGTGHKALDCQLVLLHIVCLFFQNMVLNIPGCPGTYSEDQTGLELRELCLYASPLPFSAGIDWRCAPPQPGMCNCFKWAFFSFKKRYMSIYMYTHLTAEVINGFHKLLQDEMHQQNQQAERVVSALPNVWYFDRGKSQVTSCRNEAYRVSESLLSQGLLKT